MVNRFLWLFVFGALCAGCSSTTSTAAVPVTDATETSPSVVSDSTIAVTPPRCVSPTGNETIRIWHILPDQNAGKLFNELVTEFNASQTQITLKSESLKGFGAMLDRLNATPKADWPDIVISSTASLERLTDAAGTITPAECPSGKASAAGLLPVVAAAYTADGELQAIPYGVSTLLLLFDANEMTAAGLDPKQPPTTPDALMAASKAVVERGVGKYGLVVHEWYANYVIQQWAAQRGTIVAAPNNGRNGEKISVDFNTADNRAAMKWLDEVVRTGGATWIGGQQTGQEDLVRVILDSTFTIHTSGSIGDILAVEGRGQLSNFKLGVGPMPGPGVGGLVGGNAMFMIDHQAPERAGAAWNVVRWLTESSQMARFDVATGYIPPSAAVAAEPALVAAWKQHPELKVGYDQLEAMSGSAASAGPLYGPSIDPVFWALTHAILDDHADPGAALDAASKQANQLLADFLAKRPTR